MSPSDKCRMTENVPSGIRSIYSVNVDDRTRNTGLFVLHAIIRRHVQCRDLKNGYLAFSIAISTSS